MKLVQIGGSLRVTIPKPIVEALELEAGNILSLFVNDSQIIIEKSDSIR